MHYRAVNETVIKSRPHVKTGDITGTFIHAWKKATAWGQLNYKMEKDIEINDLVVNWKNEDVHTVSEVFNRVPMMLNIISMTGARKILFVGHYNAAVKTWYHPAKSDRIIHTQPPERSTEDTVVNLNIVSQFIPIVKMAYGYTNFEMHTLKPPESRHRQLMHGLYGRYGIDLIPCDRQYKHGHNSIEIQPPRDTQYDMVVFAGVPKHEDGTRFTKAQVKAVFAPYCTEDFKIMDIYYQNKDEEKYIGGTQVSTKDYVTKAFTNRSLWDDSFRNGTELNRQVESSLLEGMISIYD